MEQSGKPNRAFWSLPIRPISSAGPVVCKKRNYHRLCRWRSMKSGYPSVPYRWPWATNSSAHANHLTGWLPTREVRGCRMAMPWWSYLHLICGIQIFVHPFQCLLCRGFTAKKRSQKKTQPAPYFWPIRILGYRMHPACLWHSCWKQEVQYHKQSIGGKNSTCLNSDICRLLTSKPHRGEEVSNIDVAHNRKKRGTRTGRRKRHTEMDNYSDPYHHWIISHQYPVLRNNSSAQADGAPTGEVRGCRMAMLWWSYLHLVCGIQIFVHLFNWLLCDGFAAKKRCPHKSDATDNIHMLPVKVRILTNQIQSKYWDRVEALQSNVLEVYVYHWHAM